jgi:hypothetical protein
MTRVTIPPMHDVFAGLSSQLPLRACGAGAGTRAAANARATKITTIKTT